MRGHSAFILLTWLSGAFLAPALTGCGKSGGEPVADESKSGDDSANSHVASDSAEDAESAATVVRDFLQAIKSGDETVSNELLTPLAREKTAELDMAVAPMGSETAKFTVGEVEMPDEGGGDLAHVASTWTDIDDDGQEHTDDILWVLRREEEGWRIGGMATKVFDDQPALLLNFEDPAEMRRKQQLAEAEMERRARESVSDDRGTDDSVDETDNTQTADQGSAISPDELQAVRPTRPTRNK